MGDLTRNLSRHEFQCRCVDCTHAVPVADYELVQAIQAACDHFSSEKGERVACMIGSANRCARHNDSVGGVPESQHVRFLAADVTIRGVTTDELYDYFESISGDRWGLGKYKTHVHIDVRPTKARW